MTAASLQCDPWAAGSGPWRGAKKLLLQALITVTVVLCQVVVSSMHPAHGQTAPMSVDDAADQWTEQLAGETSEDFMREFEKNIPLESNLRNAIKGALKSFITSEFKERWLRQDVSQAMEAILKSIRNDIVGRGVGRCEPAAVNAAWSSLAISRAMRGAANAYPDILASAAGGAGILKNIGSKALGRLRQELARLAKLALDQPDSGGLDYLRVWAQQSAGAVSEQQIAEVSPVMARVLQDPPMAGQNISEWAKQQACRRTALETRVPTVRGFNDWVITSEDRRASTREQRSAGLIDRSLDSMKQVLARDANYWESLRGFCRAKRILFPEDERALVPACQIPSRVPTDRQAARLLQLIDRAVDAGWESE